MADEQYGEAFYKGYGGRLNQYWWARRFYANIIKRYRDSGKLLEIGCGLGHTLMRLEDRFETYGIDVSEYAIEQARTNTPRSVLKVATTEEVGSLPGPFDVIAAFHVIEHLVDPGARDWWDFSTTVGDTRGCSAQGDIAFRFHLLLHGAFGVLAAGSAAVIYRRRNLFNWWPLASTSTPEESSR